MNVGELVEAGDLNGLLRAVDALAGRRAWSEMLDLADLCDDAVERGKQLWPIIGHIDYRIALEAPGDLAATVVESELSRFLLGPLTEVAASTHTWEELAPFVESPQSAAYLAQERVLRGERLVGDERAHPEILELPLELLEWEPTYALATYRSDHVEVAEPWDPRASLEEVEVVPGTELNDPEIEAVLLDLVSSWVNESNGAARAVMVEGDARTAASLLSFDTLRMGELARDEALQQMAWGASSGGAHGRRRGAAYGRFSAWYVTSVLCGYEWPPAIEELEETSQRLDWFRWDEGAAEEGWALRIAVEDPVDGWAAALAATDVLPEL